MADGMLLSRAQPGYDWQSLSFGSEAASTASVTSTSIERDTSKIPSRSITALAHSRPKSKVASPSGGSKGASDGRRAATPEPLGRLSPVQAMTNMSLHSPKASSRNEDPHPHPSPLPAPPAALEMYRIAHKYDLQDLADASLTHIEKTLTPSTALALLLETYLYPDVYARIRSYCVEHYLAISETPTLRQTLREIGLGNWGASGGDVSVFSSVPMSSRMSSKDGFLRGRNSLLRILMKIPSSRIRD